MNDPQDGITVLQRTCNHAHGIQVIDLVDRNALSLELLMYAVQPLDAALDPGLDSRLLQLVCDDPVGFGQECLSLLPTRLDRLSDLLVAHRIEKSETEIFQFTANLAHAQPVRDGCIDL